VRFPDNLGPGLARRRRHQFPGDAGDGLLIGSIHVGDDDEVGTGSRTTEFRAENGCT
jgi:hypothetical protein